MCKLLTQFVIWNLEGKHQWIDMVTDSRVDALEKKSSQKVMHKNLTPY